MVTPDQTSRALRAIAADIDSASRPHRALVSSDIERLVAALVEDDFDESKIRQEPRFIVKWDWNQKAHDSYLDYHVTMPEDPTFFFDSDNGDRPSKSREEALKFVKKNKLPGVEGKDWVIVETMYDV